MHSRSGPGVAVGDVNAMAKKIFILEEPMGHPERCLYNQLTENLIESILINKDSAY